MVTSSSIPFTFIRHVLSNTRPFCRHRPACYRPFSASSNARLSSRRQLMTDTVPSRQTELHTNLSQPPRNVGVPESSIAGGLPQDNAQRSRPQPSRRGPAVEKNSISEHAARQSTPVSATPSPQVATPTSPRNLRPLRPTSRLRPRKAAMTLTPAAVERLRGLLDDPEPKLIRVGVKNKGCSGSAYHLEYVDTPGKFDEQVAQDGVKVLIDSKALIKVIGSEMDWVEDKLSSRFTFKNPNITEQCGCGESFSVS